MPARERLGLFDSGLSVAQVSHRTAWLLIIGFLIAVVVWIPLVRLTRFAPVATLAALLTTAGISAVTLAPGGGTGRTGLRSCVLQDPREALGDLTVITLSRASLEPLLNLVLLAPLGFALVFATRGVRLAAVAVIALPALIELAQTGIHGRTCSATDLAANALGGLAGVGVGAALWWLGSRRAGGRHRRPRYRV